MQSKNNFLVYIHRLKIDGRVYVGQTCNSLKERSGSNGYRYQHCTKFWHAIQKYGWDNFEHIVVKEDLSLEEANALEAKLIEKYDSIETQKVYKCPSEASMDVANTKSAGHITEVCKGKRKTAFGYHWQYLDKDTKE